MENVVLNNVGDHRVIPECHQQDHVQTFVGGMGFVVRKERLAMAVMAIWEVTVSIFVCQVNCTISQAFYLKNHGNRHPQARHWSSVTRTVRQPELFFIELSRTFGSGSVQNVAEPLHCIFLSIECVRFRT